MSYSRSRLRGMFYQFPRVLLIGLFIASFNSVGAEQYTHIAVLYPETSPAHTRLYQTIIKGMQATGLVSISQRGFKGDEKPDELTQWINEQQAHAAIILGKASKQLSQQLAINIPLITGAHILARSDRAAVSLAAEPDILFRKLKQLSPKVQRIFVIHSEQNTGWLIKKARNAARKQDLKLEQLAIESPAEIATALNEILQKVQTGQDAIWLPLDPVIPTQSILPKLLKAAWQEELIVFSNNPIDVKRGILFAMYPDYANMGKQLVAMAQARIQNRGTAHPEASRHLKMAVNNRTASHLGITLDPMLLQQINLVYPRQ